MATNRKNFTDDFLRTASCPEEKRRVIYYDTKVPKLALVVSKTGIKTFSLHSYDRVRKKPIQQTIGRYPDISFHTARDIATKLLGEMASGVDIIEARKAVRDEDTVNDIYERWYKLASRQKRSIKDDERNFKLHIQPYFGTKKISSLTTTHVRSWFSKLTEKPRQRKKSGKTVMLSTGTANKCFALLRSIYNIEASEILNPCKGVKQHKAVNRDRWIEPYEMNQFFEALQSPEAPESIQDLIKVLLFTGARKMNVFSMQWGELNLDAGIWTVPASKSKNKEKMVIELIPLVVEILKKRKEQASSVFVFPSSGKSGHIQDPKRQWKKLIERAGLSDLRMHDLRRTCGSYQARSGSSLLIVGKSLGHLNSKTTEVYARVDSSPIRESMERGAQAMIDAVNEKKIVNMRQKK